ncbi:LOW QUALITY PROTEIN: immunoglobulin superfamily member 23-like [Kogia breviceps]|uniref:LOW QUALITY PROTEIN: immunoglobulin superfamily member 23-like n=1 Tax=Kogia breviceps TaxID=27615 RepID=UPI0034D268F3
MRCPLGAAGSGHSPAWRRMLLTGSLLAFFASSELPSSAFLDPLTEGADAHLPVPRSLDGVLSTSWFRGHKAQPEAMIFSPEGLPGPGHTGRETLDTQGSLVIRNVTTQDAGSYTVVLETSRGRRSVTEQIQASHCWWPLPLRSTGSRRAGSAADSQSKAVVDPTDPVPSKPKPTLSLSGSSAFALTVAA